MFSINQLTATIDTKPILNAINLAIEPATTHILVGPNGSGKSTLVQAILGSPTVQIESGSIIFNEKELLALSPDQRALERIFVVQQHPPAIGGVAIRTIIRHLFSLRPTPPDQQTMEHELRSYCDLLHVDYAMLDRAIHEGFSGGEKKKIEMIMLFAAMPQMIILDEIDSGLDIDARKLVIAALHEYKKKQPAVSLLVITHYQEIAELLTPDQVHLLVQGSLVASGDRSLLAALDTKGYDGYRFSR